jgi:single-strand DNA-binding protein
MFNLVVLTGRLTADPELKYTPNNTPVTSFSIAVSRRYKAGEQSEADFINIVAWRQTAEFVTKYFTKGSMIGIEGSIQTRRYTDKEGKNRTAFEVVVERAEFCGNKDNSQPTPAKNEFSTDALDNFSPVAVDDLEGDLPF